MNLEQRLITLKSKAETKHTETLDLIQKYLDNLEKEKESLVQQLETKLETTEPYLCHLWENETFRFSHILEMSPETEKVIEAYPYIKNEIVSHIMCGVNSFLANKYPLLAKNGGPSFSIQKDIGKIGFTVDVPPKNNTDYYYGLLTDLNLPDILKTTICRERVKKNTLKRQKAQKEEKLRDDLELFSFKSRDVLPDILSRFLARNHTLNYERKSCIKIAEMRTKDLEEILQFDLSYESRHMTSEVKDKYLETLTYDIVKVLEDLKLDMPGFKLQTVPSYGGDIRVSIFFDIKNKED